MEILPPDLGPYWHTALVRYRTLGTARIHTPPHRGFLGRFWASGVAIPESVAAATLPMMADATGPLIALPGVALPLLLVAALWLSGFRLDILLGGTLLCAALLYFFLVSEPRRRFRKLHNTPVRSIEIQSLKGERERATEQDRLTAPRSKLAKAFQSVRGTRPLQPGGPLERAFLQFVQEAITARDLPPAAAREIQRLLPPLGETVALLSRWEETPEEQKRQETENAVRRENLRRLSRRAGTLQEDLLGQLDALRHLLSLLTDASPSAATDYGRFTALLANIQSVIAESASLTEARSELSVSLPARIPVPEESVQRLGRSG